MELLPIFKTHCSFGKSLLTEEHPSKYKDGGKKSIFKIAEDNGLKNLVVIEDSMVGFYDMHKHAKQLGIKLIYGVLFKVGHEDEPNKFSKIALLAKNDDGIKYVMNKFSDANLENNGFIDPSSVDSSDVTMVVPFYDSFIHHNLFNEKAILPNFGENKPLFLLEEKGLPFDEIIARRVIGFCKSNNYEMINSHTILYENNEDAKALQVYKMSCFRAGGKRANIGNPNLKFFGSDKFSWEEYERRTS